MPSHAPPALRGGGALTVLFLATLIGGADAFAGNPLLPHQRSATAQTTSRSTISARRVFSARGPALRPPAGPLMSAGGAGGEGEFTDSDLKGLMERVAVMSERTEVDEVPLLVLDAMLPGQRLSFDTTDPMFKALADAATRGSFGMLGVDHAAQSMLRYGVQVDFTRKEEFSDRLSVEIVGRRRFALLGEPWMDERGFFMGRVEFMDNAHDEKPEEEGGGGVGEAVVEAVGKVDDEENERACTELEGLVKRWTDLVVNGGRERQPGQVNEVLSDLGPIPPTSRPRERAMWVAALINPLPALGVSLEIRPAVLCAPTAGEALGVVLGGIKSSIAHLDGSRPLW